MILRARGGDIEIRSAANDGTIPSRAVGGAYAGMSVNSDAIAGVPAFDAAVRFASQAVAKLNMRVWTGEGSDRVKVASGWQAKFFESDGPCPDQSWFEFWELVEASLTARRNAYVWRTIDRGHVVALWGLHPDQVMVDIRGGRILYRVVVGGGWTDPVGVTSLRTVEVDAGTLMHIKGPGGAGRAVAPTPVELFRRTLGAALAQESWQEGLYTRGTGGGVILSFPLELSHTKAMEAKELWDASNAGLENSHGTRVVSGGASVNSVGLTAEDAQFVESVNLSVEQIARITDVSASLIGGGKGIGQNGGPISPEHEATRWVQYKLVPRLERIEAAFRRDPSLFGPGAVNYPMFDNPDPVRGDRITEDTIRHQKVQRGTLLIDEDRAIDGLPPLPDGLGQIPQITPVGGAPNQAPAPPPAQQE